MWEPTGCAAKCGVDPWSDSPEFVKRLKHLYFDEGKVPVSLESSRVHKNQVLLKLKGVDTVEQADALRGKVLWLDGRRCSCRRERCSSRT